MRALFFAIFLSLYALDFFRLVNRTPLLIFNVLYF
jgi:hypothetical protein